MPRSKTGVKRVRPDREKLRSAVELVSTNKMTLYSAAKHTGLPRSTIRRHLRHFINTGKDDYTLHENNATKKVFSEEEENMLLQYIKDAASLQYGLTLNNVRELAFKFAKENKKIYPSNWDKNQRAGEFWLRLFRAKYKNRISLRKPEATSLARSTAFNRTNVALTFQNFRSALDKCGPLSAVNIWNCDETGLSTVHVPPKILASRGLKQVGTMTSAERGTNITMIAAINAGGGFAPPMLIFPRVNFKDFMITGAPPGTVGGANPSGWSNEALFTQFFKHFLRYAKPSKGSPCILLMDNHESHISVPVIQLAKDNGVTLVTFHPHTSHKMQPLDKSVFGPFKAYYNTAMNEFMTTPGNIGKPATIYDIAQLVGKAFPLAFTPSNITQGFQATGFVPLNENIFQDYEFSPSDVTDRPFPTTTADNIVPQSNPHLDDCIPSTSTAISPQHDIQPQPLTSTSNIVTPSMIRPHPKAAPRKNIRQGREKGRSRILTDTPEKTRIEEMKNAKLAKNKKAIPLKKSKCSATKVSAVKKKVFGRSESSSASSSSEDFSLRDSADSDGPIEFSEEEVDRYEEVTNNTQESAVATGALSDYSDYQVGDFVIFIYEGNYFPGKILKTSKVGAVVSSMQKTLKNWKWPEKTDSLLYSWNDIVQKIHPPEKCHSKRDIYQVKEMDKFSISD